MIKGKGKKKGIRITKVEEIEEIGKTGYAVGEGKEPDTPKPGAEDD